MLSLEGGGQMPRTLTLTAMGSSDFCKTPWLESSRHIQERNYVADRAGQMAAGEPNLKPERKWKSQTDWADGRIRAL
ncbi:hypothetical protein SCARD494_02730 [Seiridium cardinale]